jgi:hypothetical protein
MSEGSPYLPEKAERPLGERLVQIMAQLAGGAGSIGVGTASGDPFVGLGTSVATSQVVGKVGERLFARRQDRVASTISRAELRIEEREAAGQRPRKDQSVDEDRVLELLEASLKAAMNSSEQVKAELIGSLLGSAVFDEQVSLDDLLRNLRLLERLSLRQVTALAYLADSDRDSNRHLLAAGGDQGTRQINPNVEAELDELGRVLGLIGIAQKDGGVANPSNVMDGGQIVASNIDKVKLTSRGETLYRLAEINDVMNDEAIERFEQDDLFNWG